MAAVPAQVRSSSFRSVWLVAHSQCCLRLACAADKSNTWFGSPCTDCLPGTYSLSGGSCTACAPGRFGSASGSSACVSVVVSSVFLSLTGVCCSPSDGLPYWPLQCCRRQRTVTLRMVCPKTKTSNCRFSFLWFAAFLVKAAPFQTVLRVPPPPTNQSGARAPVCLAPPAKSAILALHPAHA